MHFPHSCWIDFWFYVPVTIIWFIWRTHVQTNYMLNFLAVLITSKFCTFTVSIIVELHYLISTVLCFSVTFTMKLCISEVVMYWWWIIREITNIWGGGMVATKYFSKSVQNVHIYTVSTKSIFIFVLKTSTKR